MGRRARALLADTVRGFFADECLSRGAAIAYYSLFSVAPLIIIATAIAGVWFGEDAARGAVVAQLRDLIGEHAAEGVQAMVRGASDPAAGTLATLLGLGFILFAASGTFVELQSALNAIWKTSAPEGISVSRLLRARAAAIGLVAATGFLLLTSLLASAAITAFARWVGQLLPGIELLLQGLNFLVAQLLITALFAAIYKVLPDRRIAWRDVGVGAVATALLFSIGKTLIGLHLGSSSIGTSFGAASALAVLLVWTYYSALVFLLGAEFTRAWAGLCGSRQTAPVPAAGPPRGAMLAPAPFRPLALLGLVLAAAALLRLARR
jgi:membrane protein